MRVMMRIRGVSANWSYRKGRHFWSLKHRFRRVLSSGFDGFKLWERLSYEEEEEERHVEFKCCR